MASDDAWDMLDRQMSQAEQPESKQLITKYTPVRTNNIIFITKSGAFISFDMFGELPDEAVLRAVRKVEIYFTLKATQIIGKPKQSKQCIVDKAKRRIIVPRFGIFEILNAKYKLANYCTKSQISPGDDCDLEFTGELTHNQIIITNHIINNIFSKKRVTAGSAGCILNLEAGQGKSFVAAYIGYVLQKRFCVIVHSTSMVQQWITVLNRCFPNVAIGQYYGKKKVLGDIMVMVVDSANSAEFRFGSEKKQTLQTFTSIEYYSMFGFTIFDECHEYCNNTDGKIFTKAQTNYMLGLSATPDENANKFDRIAWWGIGPVLVANELLGYQSIDSNFTATVYRVQYHGPESHTKRLVNEATAMTSTAETINMICSDQYRTALVLDCIMKCLEQNRYTYVFAWTRDYLEQLRVALSEAYHVDGAIVSDEKEFIRLVGGSKAADLEHAELKSKVIFTTYAYGATGRSIIKMDAAVLATPRKSKMKQTIGRILRLGSDASINRLIYDICDMKLLLKNQWSVRNKYYKSKLFTIETIVKHYTDIDVGASGEEVGASSEEDIGASIDDIGASIDVSASIENKRVDYNALAKKIRESLTN